MKPMISKLEAYAMAIIGVVADQLTTRLAIAKPGIYERNQHALWFMEKGAWMRFDLALLVTSIAVSMVIMRKWRFHDRWVILLYFAACFVMRFGAAVNNLLLMLW